MGKEIGRVEKMRDKKVRPACARDSEQGHEAALRNEKMRGEERPESVSRELGTGYS